MTRKCKNKCGNEIPPATKCENIISKKGYCSVECLAEHTRFKRVEAQKKKERKEIREAKERLKTRSEYTKDAQRLFNKWVRLRDADQPCISCDWPDNGTNARHASHYRSTGACGSLRFHPDNVHASCAQCNSVKSGNILEYRIRLIKKLGQEKVDWLECQPKARKWTIEELKEIKLKYKVLCRDLEKADN